MTAQDRKLLRVSVVMLTLAAVVWGYSFLVANNFFRVKEEGRMSPERQAEVLQQTRLLRDKLRPWAEKHQTLLRTMLAAKPGDLHIRDEVWKVTPHQLQMVNGNIDDLIYKDTEIRHDELLEPISYELLFGRDRMPVIYSSGYTPTAEDIESKKLAKYWLTKRTEFYWQRYRDEPYAISGVGTRDSYQLFFSGRITHQVIPSSMGDELKGAKTDLVEDVSTFEEVEAPYSFLR